MITLPKLTAREAEALVKIGDKLLCIVPDKEYTTRGNLYEVIFYVDKNFEEHKDLPEEAGGVDGYLILDNENNMEELLGVDIDELSYPYTNYYPISHMSEEDQFAISLGVPAEFAP